MSKDLKPMGGDNTPLMDRTDEEIERYIHLQKAEAARSGELSFTGAICMRNAKNAAMRLAMRQVRIADPIDGRH